MRLKKEEILGKALIEYLKKNHCEKIEDMIDIYTFAGVVYATLEALDLEPIRDSANNIKGYETKRLYIDADKMADIIGEHIYDKLHKELIK